MTASTSMRSSCGSDYSRRFPSGKDGKPEIHDNGFWEVVSGTAAFQGLKGAGTLHIEAAKATDRIVILARRRSGRGVHPAVAT